ncbi:hypothetical protein [Cryptosporangium aurantiacum]|uniref:DNA-binding protein n=1 Tax=Cryptosporangium aurantiacum TaxID=134849 RepID=A0A1M7R907_9ACTN|nr:hypothetical protein [Cryptosporangium aurantiacum]SHN42723.1 hypothetical protein SAMN05443668_108330 [Cryptosporangium aurantiacum]
MSTSLDALLDAGAVLPVGTEVASSDTVDALFTRAYQHPVLDGRTVVRLVPGTLHAAEDLSMEFLGFVAPERSTEVGTVRRQALGFPAWALVNDPANGHHALALVKEIERLARIAKSRVGPAKEGFDELGARLARAVPHFLPTYYEEAGRAFIAAESPSYAAMMFGKAREAEQSYALAVDEDREHAVFLEFALAGALTAKALTAHARTLAARSEPAAAYHRFRRLCVERTLGGLAPYAGMVADLRRLAKAARLDQAEADAEVLRDLIEAPTLPKAPEAFWKAYRPALVRLAAEVPAIRGRLLTFFPEHLDSEAWLELLAEAGATEALVAPAGSGDPAADPADSVAGWFHRFAQHRDSQTRRSTKRSAPLYALLERAADRVRADGVPLKLELDWSSDLDLYDTALALGLPVADPSDSFQVDVGQWLRDETDGRRDLAAFAADPRFLGALVRAAEAGLPRRPSPALVETALASAGLRVALTHFLDDLAESIEQQGLPTLEPQLQRLDKLVDGRLLALNPAATERIRTHDLAAVLGRTLRSGLVDEYGWPAFEQYVTESVPPPRSDDDDEKVQQFTQWPHVVLRHNTHVAVFDSDGVVLRHALRIPRDQREYLWLTAFRYVDGQLLVSWDTGPNRSAYWSGTPDDVLIELPFSAWHPDDGSLPLPGGGRTAGGRPLHVGDRSHSVAGRVYTDGRSFWVYGQDDEGASTIVEFDPATGERGRVSMPAFFEADPVDGEKLDIAGSTLKTAVSGSHTSPFAAADGLVGLRLRTTADGISIGTGIDGRSIRVRTPEDTRLIQAVRFPGSDTVFGLLRRNQWREDTLSVVDADGFVVAAVNIGARRPTFAAGTPLVTRPAGWHHLRPRDLAGSAVLRAVTDEQAALLLAAGARDHAVVEEAEAAKRRLTPAEATAEVRAAVAEVLPGVTHPELVNGLVGIVALAAERAALLAELSAGLQHAASAEPVAVKEVVSGKPADGPLMDGLTLLIPRCYDRGGEAARLLTAAGRALVDGVPPREGDLEGDHDWFKALQVFPAVLYRAVSPLYRSLVLPVGLAEREALLELAELIADLGLLAPGGRLRRIIGSTETEPGPDRLQPNGNGGRILRLSEPDAADDDPQRWSVDLLDYQPDGEFAPIPGIQISYDYPLLAGFDEETVRSYVAAARERGPIEWRPERVDELSKRAGITRAEALLLLYGLVNPGAPVRAAAEEIGIPVAALEIVDDTWDYGGRINRAALVGTLLPAEPGRIWDDGPALDGLVDFYRSLGRRAPVSETVLIALSKANLCWRPRPLTLAIGLRSPEACRWIAPLPRDAAGQVDHRRLDIRDPDADDVLTAMARALPWLAYHLPVDDELRTVLPEALRLYRARISEPEHEIPLQYFDEDEWAALADDLGTTPVDRSSRDEDRIELGPFVTPDRSDGRRVRVRPALLSGPDDPALRAFEARADESEEIEALRVVLSDWLPRLLDAAAAVDPAAGPPQDPSRSVPDLVTEAATTLGLSADAATVYLQLLALPDPTDRNVAKWTGWKPARLKKARAELAATPLVTEAKRSRASRTLFLPGGWLALKSPLPPIEAWKSPLYGFAAGEPTHRRVVPLLPIPELFAAAWDRVRNGDEPRFDELQTGRRR